jgi:superfamily II DNA helicase RecQ
MGLKQRFPDVPTMAVTATATDETMAELRTLLQCKPENVRTFNGTCFRPNLLLSVQSKDRLHSMVKQVQRWTEAGMSGIVYCGRKLDTTAVYNGMTIAGVTAAVYTADVEAKEKSRVLEAWQRGARKRNKHV